MHNIQDFITIKWSLYLPHKTFHNRPLHLTKTLQKWNNPIKRRTKRTIDAKLWFSIKRYLPGKRSINYPMEHHLSDVWYHQYIVHDNSYLHPVTLMNVIRDLWYVIDSREKKDSIRVSIDLRDTKRPNTSGVVESAIFFSFFFFFLQTVLVTHCYFIACFLDVRLRHRLYRNWGRRSATSSF